MKKVQTNVLPTTKAINWGHKSQWSDYNRRLGKGWDVLPRQSSKHQQLLLVLKKTARIDNDTITELSGHITADELTAALKAMKTSEKGADKEGVHPKRRVPVPYKPYGLIQQNRWHR